VDRYVVADSSLLIRMAAAGAFPSLRERFGTLTISQLVKEEVTARPELPGARELERAMRAGWIRVAPTPMSTWRYTDLDAGEASTLALAAERDHALVLIDDARGRERAVELGIETLGFADLAQRGAGA
jgi:predicted nucleic acid-binding protein